MFPRRKRLARAIFPQALKGGRRVSSANLSAVLLKDVYGYAVVVSKKTAPLSVTRHKIKRRVLAALRAAGHPRPAVVYPRASILKIGYDELKQELIKLLS